MFFILYKPLDLKASNSLLQHLDVASLGHYIIKYHKWIAHSIIRAHTTYSQVDLGRNSVSYQNMIDDSVYLIKLKL